MGFGDYNIQQGNGRKEKLGDIKHGVRKEQLDNKYQALFDAYDANKDGTLEAEELDNIFKGLQNFAGSDNVLDANENAQVKSIFAEQVNIQDVDFQGFVKSVSDASATILSSSEKQTPDGGKEVTTMYNDGTVETISYYPDGEYKFKKLDSIKTTKTTYYTIGNNFDKKYTAQQIEDAVKKAYNQSQNQKKNVDGKQIKVSYADFKRNYLKQYNVNQGTNVNKSERHDFELSERGKQDLAVRDFVLTHYIETHQAAKEALESMGILDNAGALINTGAGELWNVIKNVWNGTEEEYQNFYELKDKFAPSFDKASSLKTSQEIAQQHQENYFKGEIGSIDTEKGITFQQKTEQYQNATILKDRIEILDKAMLEINAYQDDVKLQKQVGRQAQGLNTENHIANAKALLLQYFSGDQKAVNMLVDNNQPEAVIETIKGIKADTDKQYQSVLAGKKYDDVKADYQNQYKAIYGTDFVPDELTEKVMDAKATGSFVKLAAITIVSILITRSPAMAQINGAIAGSAEATGAAANLMRTLVARYGQTAVAQGVKFAMTSGTLATDVGLTLLNQVTSERGFNGEELWESTKASAKFIYFGAYVGGPLAQAVSQRLGKIGVTATMFKGGAKSANGAMQTTTIAGDKLMQNLVKGGNQILTKGGAFLTDVAAFTGLEVVTDGVDLLAAGKEQLEFLPKLKIMNGIIEYVLGGRVHAGMVKAKMDAAIEQSGVKNWTIKEIKTPTKTMYEVEVAKGMPKARFANSNDLATAMLEAVAGKYEKLFNAAKGEKQKADNTPHPLPQGAREQRKVREKGVKVLEGGVTADELTEVAPFARHLEDRVTDPIAILGSDMASRASKQSFDLSKYEQTGLPLKYSRREFTQKLKDLVNNMPIEEQQAILKKFNIELIYTGNSFELADIPKLPKNSELKTPLERQIKVEIENFVKNNEFQIDNAEMKAFLDDFIKVAPEFLLTVGKKQHATHEYTLDVHTLKVLQNTMEHPEYKNLSSEEKLILNMATMLHDIGKRFIDPKTPDQTHASNSQKYAISLLDRFNLDSNIKQRIIKLIENHEFFKDYNQVYTAYIAEQEYNTKNEQSAKENGWSYTPKQEWEKIFKDRVKYHAGQFANLQDARLAKILTFADLKSVNPDGKFTKTEFDKSNNNVEVEYNGFEKMVTSTHSNKEFQDYIDKSISFIETELASNKDGKIGDELVYATELKNTSKKLFGTDDFFERIACERNKQYGVHRSDYEYILNIRQQLLDAGV